SHHPTGNNRPRRERCARQSSEAPSTQHAPHPNKREANPPQHAIRFRSTRSGPRSISLFMRSLRRTIDHPFHHRNHPTLFILDLNKNPRFTATIRSHRRTNLLKPLVAQPELRPHPPYSRLPVPYRRGLVPHHILVSKIRRQHQHVKRIRH